jgi:hypothetical protein
MVGGGVLVKTLIGIDYEISVAAVGVLMLAYVIFGGMVATTWVQIIKACMLLTGGTLAMLLADWPAPRRLIWCDEALTGPATPLAGPAGPFAVLIGPEGGFAPEEQARLRGMAGVQAISLGPRILRADTAAVAALVLWQAALGDWR